MLAFLLAATALLGSPGPGIAMLVAIGRSEGIDQGIRFFIGLQAGLAVAAALCAAGLVSALLAFPVLLPVLSTIATLYLLYLAWRIASAPTGTALEGRRTPAPMTSGALLGITNPKAYLAFVSLLASHTLVVGDRTADAWLKWLLIVAVVITVDVVWLAIGVSLKRARLDPLAERTMNVCFGLTIVATALLGLKA